ncbi:Lysophosphatidylcholine acyltransferase 2 [Perkinsus olseni]|uniref:Lysophosphatidylcholine acyltransferase 2 n=1 Tax=Perkinsus olseni TaxID=32597 RepID=A0A7J6Q3A1_PEROL|nr:Lysophosphatidylcholine acyltransferase 2 [Perkinsus olseni]
MLPRPPSLCRGFLTLSAAHRDMWGIRAGPEILAIEDKFRVSKEADARELAQLIQGVLIQPGDALVLQGMGAHPINCAVKAATIAAQRFGRATPLNVHFTGPAPGMIMNSQRRDYEIWLVIRLADAPLVPELPEETRALIVSTATRVHALAGAITSSLKERTPVDLHGIGPVCVHKMAEAMTVTAEFCRKEKLAGELLARPSFYQVQSDSDVSELGRMAHLYLRRVGDMLVFEAVGTETISTAVKAAAAAMKLADEQKPIEMEVTGPTEEIAKSMGAFAKRNSWVTLHKTRRCSEARDDTTTPPRLTASAESDRVKLAGAISLSLREHPCVEIQGIGPLCIRKIVEALEIAGVQCDDGKGQHIRASARFENLPCGKGMSRSGEPYLTAMVFRLRLHRLHEVGGPSSDEGG